MASRRWLTSSCALLALVLAGPAASASLYVNDGSTAGDLTGTPWCTTAVAGADVAGCGTCAAPCGTIKGLFTNNAVAPGDTVLVNVGTYLSATASSYPTLTASGTALAPITLRGAQAADGTPLAVLDGNGKAGACLEFSNVTNFVVRGLKCQNTGNAGSPPYGSGIYIGGISSDITLTELVVAIGTSANSIAAGIDIEPNPGGQQSNPPPPIAGTITLSNSDIGPGQFGITVVARLANVVIDSNRIHDGLHSAIYLSPGGTGNKIAGQDVVTAQVTNNVVWNSINSNGCASGVIALGYPGVTVAGNVIYANGCNAIEADCMAANFAIGANCVTWSDGFVATGNTVHQNQVASSGTTAVGEISLANCSGTGTAPLVRDNVVVQSTPQAGKFPLVVGATCLAATSDYNDWFVADGGALVSWGGTPYATLAAFSAATGRDTHSLNVDPLFVDAQNATLPSRNYRERSRAGHWTGTAWAFDPSATSPVIDRASPAGAYALEPFCSGGRRNLGAWGNTNTASRSDNACALTFSTPAQTVDAGACSAVARVQALDTDGGASVLAGSLPVTLSATPGGLTFFLDPACTSPVSAVTSSAGLASFFFKAASPGAWMVSASSPGLVSTTQTETFVGSASDGGSTPDAGSAADGGSAIDAGASVDGGANVDGGAPADAGTPTDAGSPTDAGQPPDSGTPLDAGVPDAGAVTDAGAALDAGPGDAGLDPDAGVPEPDGGSDGPAPPRQLAVGCDCTEAGGPALIGLGWVWALVLSRRRR